MPARETVKVFVRFRPLNRLEREEYGETEATCVVKFRDPQNIQILDHSKCASYGGKPFPTPFAFDRIFNWSTEQETIFRDIGEPIVDNVLAGYNGCLFAYGQTGSGKTWSMSGGSNDPNDPRAGLIPRILNKLSERIWTSSDMSEWDVQCFLAYIELYNGQVIDLMTTKFCTLRSLPKSELCPTGLLIQGLTEIPVTSFEELIGSIDVGQKNRKVSGTRMNAESSRSHALLRITLKLKNLTTDVSKSAELWLVDLAGSEKSKKTGATGDRFKEGIAINTSLTFLGSCIKELAKGKKPQFRDNPLTQLLENALTGNCKTGLVLAASPSRYNVDETLSTMRFGKRAKSITVKVSANTQLSSDKYEQIIMRLAKNILKSEMLICKQLFGKVQTSMAESMMEDDEGSGAGSKRKEVMSFARNIEQSVKKEKSKVRNVAVKSGLDGIWKRAASAAGDDSLLGDEDDSSKAADMISSSSSSSSSSSLKSGKGKSVVPKLGALDEKSETLTIPLTPAAAAAVSSSSSSTSSSMPTIGSVPRHRPHASSMALAKRAAAEEGDSESAVAEGLPVELQMMSAESHFYKRQLVDLQRKIENEQERIVEESREAEMKEAHLRHALFEIQQAWSTLGSAGRAVKNLSAEEIVKKFGGSEAMETLMSAEALGLTDEKLKRELEQRRREDQKQRENLQREAEALQRQRDKALASFGFGEQQQQQPHPSESEASAGPPHLSLPLDSEEVLSEYSGAEEDDSEATSATPVPRAGSSSSGSRSRSASPSARMSSAMKKKLDRKFDLNKVSELKKKKSGGKKLKRDEKQYLSDYKAQQKLLAQQKKKRGSMSTSSKKKRKKKGDSDLLASIPRSQIMDAGIEYMLNRSEDTKCMADTFLFQTECDSSRNKQGRIRDRIEEYRQESQKRARKMKEKWAGHFEDDFGGGKKKKSKSEDDKNNDDNEDDDEDADIIIPEGMVSIKRTKALISNIRTQKQLVRGKLQQLSDKGAFLKQQYKEGKLGSRVLQHITLLAKMQSEQLDRAKKLTDEITSKRETLQKKKISKMMKSAMYETSAYPMSSSSLMKEQSMAGFSSLMMGPPSMSTESTIGGSGLNMDALDKLLNEEGISTEEVDLDKELPMMARSSRRLSHLTKEQRAAMKQRQTD